MRFKGLVTGKRRSSTDFRGNMVVLDGTVSLTAAEISRHNLSYHSASCYVPNGRLPTALSMLRSAWARHDSIIARLSHALTSGHGSHGTHQTSQGRFKIR